MTHSRGFTLIELLVVIAIIGLLSSIVLASLNTARTKGQDAARISDVKSLKIAMELYYNDNNGYPTQNPADQVLVNSGGAGTLHGALVPKYIGSIPAVLVADGDHYYSAGVTSGVVSQYGLYVVTSTVTCKTGVSTGDMAATGWWGAIPVCNF